MNVFFCSEPGVQLQKKCFWKSVASVCVFFQIEVLSPLVAVCEQFKEQYKSFAASLDATRHELPIKNIHIEGDKQTYLGMKI